MDSQALLLFICYGNICRSPFVEALARQRVERDRLADLLRVASAGLTAWTGSPPSQEMIDVAGASGIDLSAHRARKVNAYLLDEATLVVTMTQEQQAMLAEQYPEFAARIVSLGQLAGSGEDVADPYGRDLASYQRCAEAIARLLDAAWANLLQRLGVPLAE